MLKSGLPYSVEDTKSIYTEGALVDMSDVNFPNCHTMEENYKVALTYLRNTGFDVSFDFSKLSYTQKHALIKEYFLTKVRFDIPELNETMLSVLFATANIKVEDAKTILTDEELEQFLVDEYDFIKKTWEFLSSLPIYAITRLKCSEISLDDIPETDEYFECTNFLSVIKIPAFDRLYDYADAFQPKFYKELFTEENNDLFEAMQELSFMVILDSMCSKTPEEFTKILEGITLGI